MTAMIDQSGNDTGLAVRITLFGHACVLVESNGTRVLIDPGPTRPGSKNCATSTSSSSPTTTPITWIRPGCGTS